MSRWPEAADFSQLQSAFASEAHLHLIENIIPPHEIPFQHAAATLSKYSEVFFLWPKSVGRCRLVLAGTNVFVISKWSSRLNFILGG